MRISGALAALAVLVAGCGGQGSAEPVGGLAGLRECLDDAGAKIAKGPNDLKFVGGGIPSTGSAGELADGTATYSFYNGDDPDAWTVYTGGGESFTANVAQPDRAGLVVAYVKPADPATVAAADDCLDGVLGDG